MVVSESYLHQKQQQRTIKEWWITVAEGGKRLFAQTRKMALLCLWCKNDCATFP